MNMYVLFISKCASFFFVGWLLYRTNFGVLAFLYDMKEKATCLALCLHGL
jgi:hypothetical protein